MTKYSALELVDILIFIFQRDNWKCNNKKDIEKKEAVLIKNGGNDPSIKHKEIVKMKEKLDSLDEELKPLSRQLQGFLSLPPSVDLAKMELAKKEVELETLEQQLAGSISDMHL